MYHDNRRWRVQHVESAEELADKLGQYSWCGCAGFELEGHLWLNDSTSPDAVQEYAVVRKLGEAPVEYRQIESITVGWCSREQLLEYIEQLHNEQPAASEADEIGSVAVTRTAAELLQALGVPSGPPGFLVTPRLETPQTHGSCGHCR